MPGLLRPPEPGERSFKTHLRTGRPQGLSPPATQPADNGTEKLFGKKVRNGVEPGAAGSKMNATEDGSLTTQIAPAPTGDGK